MSLSKISISDVNAMDYGQFVIVLGNVIERGAMIVSSVWRKGPFNNVEHLHRSLCDQLDQLSLDLKAGYLRLLPALDDQLDSNGTLSKEQVRERKSARLHGLSSSERQRFTDLNQKYKLKFGFPFVMCCRENDKASILSAMEKRVKCSRETELSTNIDEIKEICRLRLMDIVNPESQL